MAHELRKLRRLGGRELGILQVDAHLIRVRVRVRVRVRIRVSGRVRVRVSVRVRVRAGVLQADAHVRSVVVLLARALGQLAMGVAPG